MNKKTKEKTLELSGDVLGKEENKFVNTRIIETKQEDDVCLAKAGNIWYELHDQYLDRHFRPRLQTIKKLLLDIS